MISYTAYKVLYCIRKIKMELFLWGQTKVNKNQLQNKKWNSKITIKRNYIRKMTCFQHKINAMNSINNKHFNHIMNESTNYSTSELRINEQ